MSVNLLVDNDVVIKLARMNAYPDGMASLGRSPAQVGSLRVMLRYMGIAEAGRRARLTKTAAEADRLGEALHSIVEVEITPEESSNTAKAMKFVLENELDIQEGELALSVVASMRGSTDVATGDKRALRSLPALEAGWSPLGALRNRFICFEQIFRRICQAHGIVRVRKAVADSPRADETVALVYSKFGSDPSRFVAALDMVIKEQVERPAPGWLGPD